MESFALFVTKLLQLEQSLQALSREFAELPKQFEGTDFSAQNGYATHLENLILAVTHESASTIGLTRNELIITANFIEFRKKHNQFSNSQLLQIIDNNSLSVEQKLALKKQLATADTTQLLATLAAVKKDWNATFTTKTYQQITSRLTF